MFVGVAPSVTRSILRGQCVYIRSIGKSAAEGWNTVQCHGVIKVKSVEMLQAADFSTKGAVFAGQRISILFVEDKR